MIKKEEVIKIAKLARLELTGKEIEKMQKDLSSILGYFNILKKAPLKSVETHGGSLAFAESEAVSSEKRGSVRSELREDKVVEKPASLANNLIAAAPNKKEEYIKVKQIFQ